MQKPNETKEFWLNQNDIDLLFENNVTAERKHEKEQLILKFLNSCIKKETLTFEKNGSDDNKQTILKEIHKQISERLVNQSEMKPLDYVLLSEVTKKLEEEKLNKQ